MREIVITADKLTKSTIEHSFISLSLPSDVKIYTFTSVYITL